VDPAPVLLSISESGRFIGVGRTTIYSLVSKGELPVVHVGRRALIPRHALVAFVERLCASNEVQGR
jgi:excisionase family DNA binding protein